MYNPDIEKALEQKYAPYNLCEINFKYFSFSEDTKYVSDNIKEEDIAQWNHKQPVFISAQTGRGKNFFLKDILVRMIHDENTRKSVKRKILILSNRIALNRQSKKDWNLSLMDITGDNNEEKFESYTDKGIDKFLSDLGTVTVCSYQQLLDRASYLKKQHFEYVIADECHFFTSDAIFNPFTHQILKLLVEKFKKSVRVYMSATLEESFVPIITAEYPDGYFPDVYFSEHYPPKRNECLYYYFERNFNYIKEICAYDKLDQLVEKIKRNHEERWLIFVSSKRDGQNLSELCSNENIDNIFLTRESKDSKENSKEYDIYKQIIEKEKFSVQVLISTSVLDNGVNLKDSSIKHVVIDMLDQTEFIQMLGRIRMSGDNKLNLYIRQYTDEDIEKFFLDDLKKLIRRLKITSVPNKLRPRYFHNLLGNQTEVQHMFYLTGDDECFTYNPCAVFKLVTRLSTFFKILKSKSNYFLNPEMLGVLRDDRTKLYTKYSNNANFHCPYRNFLLEPICQMLELADENKKREDKLGKRHILKSDSEDEDWDEDWDEEENTTEDPELPIDLSNAIELTFLAYVFKILIPQSFHKIIIPPAFNSCHTDPVVEDNQNDKLELNQTRNYYDSILTLSESDIPVLTEQSHWIGINNLMASDFVYAKPITPILSDSQITEILNLLAIQEDEYLVHTDKEKRKNSAGKGYISFKNAQILKEKGCKKSLISKFKEPMSDEIANDNNATKYIQVIDWLRKVKEFHFDKLEELVDNLDNKPFHLDKFYYKLKIVRGTQKNLQNDYCLFVKLNSQSEL